MRRRRTNNTWKRKKVTEGIIWKREWERIDKKGRRKNSERAVEKNGEEGKDEEGEEEILNWQDIKVCFVRAKRESGPAWPAFTPEMLRAVGSLKLVEPKKPTGERVLSQLSCTDLELKFNDSGTTSTWRWCRLWINRNAGSKLYRNFPGFIRSNIKLRHDREMRNNFEEKKIIICILFR